MAVALAPGADGAAAARAYAKFYLQLPNYTSQPAHASASATSDVADGGSDRLISAVIPHGPEASAHRSASTWTRAPTTWCCSRSARRQVRRGQLGELASIAAGLPR